ncbi:hypothetical protein G6F68_017512 [Rhizopus microsporus]|nr:hypothetical protein G6F68_017512 [Rhizopus microsporus]
MGGPPGHCAARRPAAKRALGAARVLDALEQSVPHFLVLARDALAVQRLAPRVERDQRQYAESVDQVQALLAVGVLATGDIAGRHVMQHDVGVRQICKEFVQLSEKTVVNQTLPGQIGYRRGDIARRVGDLLD